MRRAFAILAAALVAASCLLLAGCFGIPSEPQVAASVNGEEILESEVTDYIEGFRSQNPEYESDEGWAGFLRDNGYTAESIRRFVLDSVFIPQTLIHQQCAERGIALTDSELDAVIARERAYYEGRYGDNSWDSVLSSYGYDEESWRENETNRLLEEQLIDEVIGAVEPTPEEIQSTADEEGAAYNGKHSWYLSFSSESSALDALSDLRALQGDISASDFRSAAGSAHDAGWNSLPDDRDNMSTEYITALNELTRGEYSDVIQLEDQWIVVFCDRVYNVEKAGSHVDLESMPAAIYEQVVQDARDAVREQEFSRWMQRETESASIQYADIPEGLPYDVNVAVDREGQ